ncbi:MAG: hypothetical protein OSJ65_05890 [Bacilli bacterium]|nr:hypothetical protein [Bacilli bacterium]
MPELSLFEIIKYSLKSLLSSEVFILVLLELAIVLIAIIFRRLMNKKVVKNTSIIASLIVLGFYVSKYISTVLVFLNNVSTRLIEVIYFPTTLEFMLVMVISFVIMGSTLLSTNTNKYLKIINSVLPLTISFLFLCIIEYINVNSIPFDEFSVFTNPILMSLYELSMGLFMSWIIALIVVKVDKFIINSITVANLSDKTSLNLVTVTLPSEKQDDEDIELPKLKNGVIK